MRCLFPLLLCCLASTACNRGQPVQPATPMPTAAASASTTVDGVTLHTSTANIADLNEAVANRYGIDRAQDGVLLLVTVRDAAGNGTDPGDLQLAATVATLPDPPKPLELRVIFSKLRAQCQQRGARVRREHVQCPDCRRPLLAKRPVAARDAVCEGGVLRMQRLRRRLRRVAQGFRQRLFGFVPVKYRHDDRLRH